MLAAILFASINVSAQTIVPLDENAMYFTTDELPDATVWLPAPPDTLSTQFVYDVTQYMWGKTQREDPQRAQQAIDNVVVDVAEMAEQFSVPFGMEISKEKTPAIFHVLYFQEPTLIPEEEESLRNNGSYPSGHSIRGWAFALLLCEINPDAQDAILKLGYEWGQSRVIVGYHWQSDVDASRLLGSAVYARLHTNPQFLADMAAARKEFARLKAKK